MTRSATIALLAIVGMAGAAAAQTVMKQEPPSGALKRGSVVLVDDGSCPAGQIKEVSGSQMTAAGIVAVRKCIQRLGTKKR